MNTRREFIISSTAWLAANGALQALAEEAHAQNKTDQQWIMGASGRGLAKNAGDATLYPDQPGEVVAFCPETGESRSIKTTFFPHIVEPHPITPHLAFACTKWGRTAALFDFKARKVLTEIHPPQGNRFFGHPVWSRDAKTIFVSSHNDRTANGEILVYDTQKMELKARVPSGGRFPHQMLLDKNDQLVIQNQSQKPTSDASPPLSLLTVFDTYKGTVTKTTTMASPGLGHIAIHGLADDCWSGGFLPTGPDFHQRGDARFVHTHGDQSEIITLPIPPDGKKLQGELLSINFSPRQPSLLGITVCEASYAAIYDIESKKFLMSQTFPNQTKGVHFSTVEDGKFYLSTLQGHLLEMELKKTADDWKVNIVKTYPFADNGSHIKIGKWA